MQVLCLINLFNNNYFSKIYFICVTSIITKFCAGKFRTRLIELTSFKSKLLIRFIMNKPY